MLASRHAVFLTGDFRLTYSGGRTSDDLSTQKIIPVYKFEWCALVSFSGVAILPNGMSVGNWIAKQILETNKRDSVASFVSRLRKADAWLSTIGGDNRLHISIVGFHGRRPFIKCLSNFQDIDGRNFTRISKSLKLFSRKPKKEIVGVFGDTQSVSKAEQSIVLKKLALNHLTLNDLAEINKNAATRSKSVSRQCVAGRIQASGNGEITPFGIDDGDEYMPNFVMDSLAQTGITAFKLKTDSSGAPLKPRWKGMTLKVQGKIGRGAIFAGIHVFANISEPIKENDGDGTQVFWKIATANEPKTVTFNVRNNPK